MARARKSGTESAGTKAGREAAEKFFPAFDEASVALLGLRPILKSMEDIKKMTKHMVAKAKAKNKLSSLGKRKKAVKPKAATAKPARLLFGRTNPKHQRGLAKDRAAKRLSLRNTR